MINTQITRRVLPVSVHVKEAGEGRAFIAASVKSSDNAHEAASLSYTQIAEVLSKRGMVSVHERIFGSLIAEHNVMSARRQAFTSFGMSPENAVTYIEGNPPWGEGLAGVIIHAVKTDEAWTVMDSGMPCGCGWRQNGVTHLVLQDIQPPDHNRRQNISKPLQSRFMIERAERILRENGASYGDVVRTWFYLSDILGWYAAFNKARNEKYGEFGIMPGPGDRDLLLPASTGIAGDSRAGAACAMDLIAVLNSKSCTRKLSNPSQLDAFRYGSAFARASVVKNGNTDLIEVSGTAAIDEHGVSLYPGDIRAQIDCTLNKVQTLLAHEGSKLQDISSATVFVKRGKYAEIFHEMATARGLEDLPCVCVVADVCREELLFEMDAETIVRRS